MNLIIMDGEIGFGMNVSGISVYKKSEIGF
jgi:hypothetical protein